MKKLLLILMFPLMLNAQIDSIGLKRSLLDHKSLDQYKCIEMVYYERERDCKLFGVIGLSLGIIGGFCYMIGKGEDEYLYYGTTLGIGSFIYCFRKSKKWSIDYD